MESGDNPGDAPSRFLPVREPRCPAHIPEHLLVPELPGVLEAAMLLWRHRRIKVDPGLWPEVLVWRKHPLGPSILEHIWAEVAREKHPLWARELFAGFAGLTVALQQEGIPCRSATEAFPGGRRYSGLNDLERDDVYCSLVAEVVSGAYFYMHFGTPCAQ